MFLACEDKLANNNSASVQASEWVRRKNDLVWKREEFKKKPRTKFEKQLNAQDNTERDLCEMAFQQHKTKKK